MTTGPLGDVLRRLRGGDDRTDAELLADYAAGRDAAALAAVVRRHAPMVWGVCRRSLRDHHDAEDAFQATFLVLARKAGSLAAPGRVANWLYGVAARTARKARATAAARRTRERLEPDLSVPAEPEPRRHPLEAALDDELGRLPAKYRAPVVLCDLEGKTRDEAARELGCPPGTVAGRLARARELLAKRLARHGLALPPALVLTADDVPAAALDAASPRAAALADGVLAGLAFPRRTAVALVVVVAVGIGAATQRPAPQPSPPAQKTDEPAPRDVLRGEWRVISLGGANQEIREQVEAFGRLRVAGDRATLVLEPPGFEPKKTITFAEFTVTKLDLTATPATVDVRLDSLVGHEPRKTTTAPGILHLEGDTLKLHFGEDARPKAFPEKGADGLIVLRRVPGVKAPDPPPAPKERAVPPNADKKGFAVSGATVKDGKVEFGLSHGKNVTGVVRFIVSDDTGEVLWSVMASGQNPVRHIVYGVPPADPSYAGRRQLVPADGAAPADIRGRTVRVRVDYRFTTFLGPGTEVYETTIAVPRE